MGMAENRGNAVQQNMVWLSVGIALTSLALKVDAQTCPCNGGAGTLLDQTSVVDRLTNRTACAIFDQDRWQEFHGPSAQLLELGNKVGGEVVGTWAVSTDGRVSYTYGSTSYSYQVCEEGTAATVDGRSYHFCGARNITNARH